MLTRPLPGTDLQVSALGFGCWTIGGEYWGDDVDDERSIAAVRTAYACGITLFDTAPLYGRGHADELLVRALGERRHDVAIATKVGVRLDLAHARSDLRPEHVVADAEGTPLDDTVAALEGLVDRGDVRYWGLCNFGPQAVRQARGAVVLQTPYSLLRREFEGELAAAVAERDLGVFAYEPLCRGLLTGKFRAPRTFPDSDLRSRDDRFTGPWFARSRPLIEGLEAVGQKLGVPTAAVALAWVADRPHVTAALVGARSPEQVRANVQAVRLLGKPRIRAVLERLGDSWSG